MDGREHRALLHLHSVGPNIGAIANQWNVQKGSQFATMRLHTHATKPKSAAFLLCIGAIAN